METQGGKILGKNMKTIAQNWEEYKQVSPLFKMGVVGAEEEPMLQILFYDGCLALLHQIVQRSKEKGIAKAEDNKLLEEIMSPLAAELKHFYNDILELEDFN